MKEKTLFTLLMIFFLASGIYYAQRNSKDWPMLKGPYLGQKPPGTEPEIFAPGIVSTRKNEALFGFFNSGTRILFSRTDPDFNDWKNEPIFVIELKKGVWTKPRLSAYIGKPWYLNLKPFPPGKTLFFAHWGDGDSGAIPKNLDIWEVKGTVRGWSVPRKLPPPVNSDTIDTFPTESSDNTLYFFSGRKGGLGGDDIYLSRLINRGHSTVENLGPAINSTANDIDPFIAPDGSYLVFCSDRPEGLGKVDMYISFKQNDGLWTSAVNLGKNINSSAYDWIPFISEDGKYLFFISNRTGNYDIYWVDAKIIEEIKDSALHSPILASNQNREVVNDGYGDYLLVPAGECEMGDNFNEGQMDERPVHKVYPDTFYIGKYEVTNGEYKKFIDDGGYEKVSYWSAGGFGKFGTQPLYWDNNTDADPRDGKRGTTFYR